MKTSTRFATAVVCIMVFAIAATAQTAPTTTTATTGPSWYLVDADKSYNDPASRLRPLADDDQLYLAELPAHVNVEYVPATTQKIGSLVTTDNGKRWQPSPVEGQKPWSVAGDDSHGKWVTLPVDPGIHQYAAKAFAGWNAGAVIETSTVRVNVAPNRPAPETQPCSQPSTQPGVIGTVAQQPPAFPTISRIDTTTLATAAWAGRTSFKGAPGTNYIVPRGWGAYSGDAGFDLDLNGAVLTFASTSGDRLINFTSSSRGFTIRNGSVVLGTPEARLGFARVGGTDQTFRNLAIYGGSDVFNANGDGSRRITLDHVWQVGPYRGNWFYNGDDQPGCVHEDWLFRNVYVVDPIAMSGGISHVLRLYCLKNFYAADCVFTNPQTTNPQGAGIRIHSTKGGFQTIERCTIGGYENRVGPLLLHPEDPNDLRDVRNVTFRDCAFDSRWHITNNTFCLMFDHCLFDVGNNIPLGATDPGNYYTDSNHNGRWDVGEPVSTPWPEIKLAGCLLRSTAQTGRMIDAIDQAKVTIVGGRAVNPTRNYDGPVKFVVP